MKISSRGLILVSIFALFALSLGFSSHFISKNEKASGPKSLASNTTFSYEQGKVNYPLPVRLKIPKINVDAPIDYVGLTPEGRVDVPRGPASVAWFSLGPRPGALGSSIIDGHSGYKDNREAVFDDLYKLESGDKIFIVGSGGEIISFVVRELRSYDKDEDATEVFLAGDSKAHLNLVTCVGDWNEREKTHSKRLVVFADREI